MLESEGYSELIRVDKNLCSIHLSFNEIFKANRRNKKAPYY